MPTTQDLEDVASRAAEAALRRVPGHGGGISMDQLEKAVDRAVEETAARIIGPAVAKAVADSFATLGIDSSNRIEFMKDLIFLRDMRNLSSDSKKHVVLSILGLVTAAVVGGFFAYSKATGKAP